MKNIIFIAMILTLALATSCGNKDNTNNGGDGGSPAAQKQFKSAAEAANAAKEDMLSLMDKVNFGVNRDELKAANPGMPASRQMINWDMLLKADSGMTMSRIADQESSTVVPLVNGVHVVAAIQLKSNGSEYSIAALGDKQISSELDIVRKADSMGMKREIRIYEVPNLNATVYELSNNNIVTYYTSYNNNSLRNGLSSAALFKIIRSDAIEFQRRFGDELKKGKLVK